MPSSSNADGYPALRLHSAVHTCPPISLLRGQCCSCLLESFHRSLIFSYSELTAGSFAVASIWSDSFHPLTLKCTMKEHYKCWFREKHLFSVAPKWWQTHDFCCWGPERVSGLFQNVYLLRCCPLNDLFSSLLSTTGLSMISILGLLCYTNDK